MISEKVLNAFGIKGGGKRLEGGQDNSWKFGEIVLKPVEDEDYYSFTADVFSRLQPKEYRISKPILSIYNKYVEYGYAATKYEGGIEDDYAIKEKLNVSKHLHKDLKMLGINELPKTNDPWTKANNVLWRGHTLPKWDKETNSLCEDILKELKPIDKDYQLIHADLGGNILFDEELKPLVIDFSPTIAPAPFADAIIVCDSIAWAGLDIDIIKYLEPLNFYKPYIQYSIAFRVFTIAFNNNYGYERLLDEWHAYKKIWDYVKNK